MNRKLVLTIVLLTVDLDRAFDSDLALKRKVMNFCNRNQTAIFRSRRKRG